MKKLHFCVCLGLFFVLARAAFLEEITISSLYSSTSLKYLNKNEDSLMNPNNILSLDPLEIISTGVLSGDILGFRFEFAATGDWVNPNPTRPLFFYVNEFFYSIPISDSFFLTIGKKRLHWDSTPFVRPLDFFDTNRMLMDISESALPSEGRFGIISHYEGNAISITMALFDDRWVQEDIYNLRGGLHSGIRLRIPMNFFSLSIASNVIYTETKKVLPALGLLFDTTIGDCIKLYGSGIVRKGSLEVLSQNALDSEKKVYLTPSIGQLRISDSSWFPFGTAGIQWNPNYNNTFYFAIVYDSNKYSQTEWNSLIDAIDFHSSSSLDSIYPSSLLVANQAWDGSVSKNLFLKQAHLASRWSFQTTDFLFSVNYILSLVDLSGFGKGAITFFINDTISFDTDFVFFAGKEKSEFGSYPIRYLFGLGMSYVIK